MIYTLCLSPAIDYNMYIDNVKLDAINKSKSESFHAGGKAINVSLILKELGIESTCLGFLGGFTGKFIKEYLDKENIRNDFVWINQDTRINVKIKTDSGETAIDGTGPLINKKEEQELLDKFNGLCKGDILVLSGNTCSGVDETIYERILDRLNKDVVVIVDSVRYLLMSTLKYHPLFIKPNIDELEEVLNTRIDSDSKLLECAKLMQNKGARNVIVSLGDKGAFILEEDGNSSFIEISKTNKTVINTIGCGDSVVAGTIYGYLKKMGIKGALEYGVACGTACAYQEHFAKKEDIEEIYKYINIKK